MSGRRTVLGVSMGALVRYVSLVLCSNVAGFICVTEVDVLQVSLYALCTFPWPAHTCQVRMPMVHPGSSHKEQPASSRMPPVLAMQMKITSLAPSPGPLPNSPCWPALSRGSSEGAGKALQYNTVQPSAVHRANPVRPCDLSRGPQVPAFDALWARSGGRCASELSWIYWAQAAMRSGRSTCSAEGTGAPR